MHAIAYDLAKAYWPTMGSDVNAIACDALGCDGAACTAHAHIIYMLLLLAVLRVSSEYRHDCGTCLVALEVVIHLVL